MQIYRRCKFSRFKIYVYFVPVRCFWHGRRQTRHGKCRWRRNLHVSKMRHSEHHQRAASTHATLVFPDECTDTWKRRVIVWRTKFFNRWRSSRISLRYDANIPSTLQSPARHNNISRTKAFFNSSTKSKYLTMPFLS